MINLNGRDEKSSTYNHKLVHKPIHQSTSSYGFSRCEVYDQTILREHKSWISTGFQTLSLSNKGNIQGIQQVRYFSFKHKRYYRSFSQSIQQISLGMTYVHGRNWCSFKEHFQEGREYSYYRYKLSSLCIILTARHWNF